MRALAIPLLFAAFGLMLQGQPRTDAEREQFLLSAEVTSMRASGKGITGTRRATLSNGAFVHDASIQTIDEFRARFETPSGVEMNFRDTWRYNIAAYRLSRMLGITMVPPSVERRLGDDEASFTWWVDDVAMDEGERVRRKLVPPNVLKWNEQMYTVRVFDQLLDNIDRNPRNLLIDGHWRIWMIDHSRAFRLSERLRQPQNLIKCERGLLEALRRLDESRLAAEIGRYVAIEEQRALLKRRDGIVQLFSERGEESLFTATPD